MITPTGIAAVRWWTSPTAARVLERLECKGDATPDQLAAELHIAQKYAYNIARRVLLVAQVIHVVGWMHNYKGAPTPLYRLGPGTNKPQPKPETAAQRAKRRRVDLVRQYGSAITEKLLNQKRYGRPRIHLEGRQITCGSHTAQLAGRISK